MEHDDGRLLRNSLNQLVRSKKVGEQGLPVVGRGGASLDPRLIPAWIIYRAVSRDVGFPNLARLAAAGTPRHHGRLVAARTKEVLQDAEVPAVREDLIEPACDDCIEVEVDHAVAVREQAVLEQRQLAPPTRKVRWQFQRLDSRQVTRLVIVRETHEPSHIALLEIAPNAVEQHVDVFRAPPEIVPRLEADDVQHGRSEGHEGKAPLRGPIRSIR